MAHLLLRVGYRHTTSVLGCIYRRFANEPSWPKSGVPPSRHHDQRPLKAPLIVDLVSAPDRNRTCDLRFRKSQCIAVSDDQELSTCAGLLSSDRIDARLAQSELPTERHSSGPSQPVPCADAPATPTDDAGGTNDRQQFVSALSAAIAAGNASGDHKLVQVAARALFELVGDGATDDGAVVDLSDERAKRGSS